MPGRLLLAGVAVAAVLGCARPAAAFELFGLRLWGEEEAEELPVVDPLNYQVALDTGVADDELAKKLRAASTLVADEGRPVSGSLGLLSKARSERELLVAALYEEARYDATVEIRIDGRSLDDLPPDTVFDASGPVPVRVTVDPGRVFRLGDIELRGDAADLAPARFGLIAGGEAGSRAILKAEADIVRALRGEGRPLAAVTGREVVADSATGELDVAFTVEAGPVAVYGETRVEGTETVDRDFTAHMAGLEPGRTYSPEEMEEARDRLLALEVFDRVSVGNPDALDPDGSIPVDVAVHERKHRYFGVGATYSNTEGGGIEGYWGHRNLFGRAEKLRLQGSLSRIGNSTEFGKLDYNAALLFEKPGVLGPPSKFTANVKAVYEHPDAFDNASVGGALGLSYELDDKQTLSAGLSLQYSRIDDAFGSSRHLIGSIPIEYVYDRRDDRLNPKEGYRLLAFAEPSYGFLSGATFVKMKGEVSAYQAIDEARRFVLAGRAAIGSIVGAGLEEVPADRRFYAGGGGSVRGYSYQGIGPRNDDNKPTGGLSFAEASIEMRIEITETLGIVPFVDAGTVSTSQTPDFSDISVGAGVGVRYLTPFGPLRIDVGIPLNRREGDPSFGIYAGVGQAF